jgi:2,4-dienoyl-CoA reductase-like NADH-dependent reductase (Old Yellow Enzyme family)
MSDWHIIHLGQLALSGAALLTIEATAVLPEGRITYGDVGLYSDDTEVAMARVMDTVRQWSDMPIAIQLAHAGRKASTEKPWLGDGCALARAFRGSRFVAERARPRRPCEGPPSVRRCGQTRGPARTRCHTTARRARIFAAPVFVAAIEPT